MKYLNLFLFILCSNAAYSQALSLKGRVSDQRGEPIPFASIYINNTSKGTSANSNGEFQLRLTPGSYELIVKAIGFKAYTHPVDLNASQEIQIKLITETFELKDIVIKVGGEDPAYGIIRKAIKAKKAYLRQVQPYNVDVYIKGLQRLLKAPKKFLGVNVENMGKEMGLDSNRRGIIYLSESESRLSFNPPDDFREEMLSSKISGSSRSFSFNRATDMNLDFYKNYQSWGDLTNRPIVSPIADNALSYYNYKLIGTTEENGTEINKIRVTPKRQGEPAFTGEIYIRDDSWWIHSANLFLTKNTGISFVDTVKISQTFVQINNKVWYPANARFDFVGGLFGFEIEGYFIAFYRNYDFDVNFNKKDFRELLKVNKDANKKDSVFWSQARPIPLTAEEQQDYVRKQAFEKKKQSRNYLDSLDKKYNQFKPLKFLLLGGYTHRNRYKNESYSFSPLLKSVYYNTVEGWGIDYGISYRRNIDTVNNRYLYLEAKSKYAFSPQRFNPLLSGTIPIRKSRLSFSLGSDIIDLNAHNTIPAFANSINSLLYERNFTKLYHKKGLALMYSTRIAGGLRASFSTEWSEREWLPNTTDYKWNDLKSRSFTSNNPFNHLVDEPLFSKHQALTTGLRLTYNFSNKYLSYPSGRYYIPSKYPEISLTYNAAIKGLLDSDAGYQALAIEASKADILLGMLGKSSFHLGLGKYFSVSSIFYPDYKDFRGNQSLSYASKTNNFLFLDNYVYSTMNGYVEAHYQHNFSGLLMNKLPVIRKLKLKEVIGANYLNTRSLKNHTEIYTGLQYLNITAQYGFSFTAGRHNDTGIRLAIQL